MEYPKEELRNGMQELGERMRPVFKSVTGYKTAQKYLQGILSPVERKNGWQLSEALGKKTPYAMQQMLYRGRFSADELMEVCRSYVSEKLWEEDGTLVVDETGFLKQGKKSCGVKRQYSGTAGRIQNCQVGVFLTYATGRGHAILDRRLYLPDEWCEDKERRDAAGVPETIEFHTKPEMALEMIQEASKAQIPYQWVTGDCVYGDYRSIRLWLEEQSKCYVMNVSSKEYVYQGWRQVKVGEILRQLPDDGWKRAICGEGSKGAREYEWTLVQVGPLAPEGWRRSLLVRRGKNEKGEAELHAYVCYAPQETSMDKLIQIAGMRWTVERCFADSKAQVGLDQYEVRSYMGWYKHITFCCLALALLAVLSYSSMDTKRMQEYDPSGSSLDEFKKKRGLLVSALETYEG
jgi:SRSO17 transposase